MIRNLDISNFENQSDVIDEAIKAHNDFDGINPRIKSVLKSIIDSGNRSLMVKDLATENDLTIKSLERLIRKMFGISPKKLVSILRFGNSIKFLNKTDGHQFIDVLQFGYYDQSHFIRERRKITEMNPTEVLSELSLSTNDMMFSTSELMKKKG